MGRNSIEYESLSAEEGYDAGTHITSRRSSQRWIWILSIICIVQGFVNVLQWVRSNSKGECLEPRILYSPAYEVVEPEIKVFTVGTSWAGLTRWEGEGPETDAAWQELYNSTIMRIPKEQAALLPNRTAPIVGDPEGYYIAQIEVFHQLHCLNMIRMKLGGEYYRNTSYELKDEHIAHCVDSIRQSLMCTSDVSVNVWQWRDKTSRLIGHTTQAHQCRNFEKIRDWAKERAMLGDEISEWVKPAEDDLV